jgi:hypothetical protein
MPLNRRDFLVKSALTAGAFAGWPAPRASALAPPFGIDLRLSVGPIDHVIVLMMENRSFDHYFGWRTGTQHQVFLDHPTTRPIPTTTSPWPPTGSCPATSRLRIQRSRPRLGRRAPRARVRVPVRQQRRVRGRLLRPGRPRFL